MLQNELEERIELESARIIEKKEYVLLTSVLTERLLGRNKSIDYTTFELTYSNGDVKTECVKNDSLLFRVYSSKCN